MIRRGKLPIALAVAAGITLSLAAVAPSAIAAWTTSSTAQFTQSSAVVPPVTFTSCAHTSGGRVTLTWAAAPSSVNGSTLKDYLVEWLYTSGGTVNTATMTSTKYVFTATGMTGDSSIRVTARYVNGWQTLAPTSYPITRSVLNRAMCNPSF